MSCCARIAGVFCVENQKNEMRTCVVEEHAASFYKEVVHGAETLRERPEGLGMSEAWQNARGRAYMRAATLSHLRGKANATK